MRRLHSLSPTPTAVTLHRLGRVGYGPSQALQRALSAEVRSKHRGDTLLVLEHPPVFTLGRLQASAQNVLASEGEIAAAGASIYQSERGGNVTFHGPGQLVAYPLLDLSHFTKSVHWYGQLHSSENLHRTSWSLLSARQSIRSSRVCVLFARAPVLGLCFFVSVKVRRGAGGGADRDGGELRRGGTARRGGGDRRVGRGSEAGGDRRLRLAMGDHVRIRPINTLLDR